MFVFFIIVLLICTSLYFRGDQGPLEGATSRDRYRPSAETGNEYNEYRGGASYESRTEDRAQGGYDSRNYDTTGSYTSKENDYSTISPYESRRNEYESRSYGASGSYGSGGSYGTAGSYGSSGSSGSAGSQGSSGSSRDYTGYQGSYGGQSGSYEGSRSWLSNGSYSGSSQSGYDAYGYGRSRVGTPESSPYQNRRPYSSNYDILDAPGSAYGPKNGSERCIPKCFAPKGDRVKIIHTKKERL